MPTDPDSPGDPPPDAVDQAAAIDDFFGGFSDRLPHDPATLRADGSPLPGSLDLLLLLRQAAAAGAAPHPGQPESIGRYRILRQAGRGGFAVVWEAFDPVLRRRVAVKVCTPDALVSPSVRRRFRREAELASRLMHSHIVTIHEVGDDGGLEFITCEFCEGGSLADWLARHPGPVPPAVAARIARAIAQAAAHAHEAGVVHRDIKPGNVMLLPVDSHDPAATILPPEPVAAATADPASSTAGRGLTVKLGDFGLGRLSDPGEAEDPLTQLTTDGARLGTPAWMAPEQIDRSFGPVGVATDIHAIGLILDRMLTGRPLRGGTTDVETYRAVLLDEPVAADRVARGVPADLAAVCLKCLEKRPDDRYPSAGILADDLGRWLAGLPTRARPLPPLRRLIWRIARRPLVTGLAATAAVAMGIATWFAIDHARERERATANRAVIRRQEAAAELKRGFDSLRAANVAGALEQIEKTRDIDPELADSLAARWLERRLHGERDILVRPRAAANAKASRTDLHCLAISPDGTVAVAGGADGVLRVLTTHTGQTSVREVPAHDEVNDVCISPDGRLIASAGQDGRLRWWRLDALDEPAGEAPPAGCPLYAVAFEPGGASLVYGGSDRVLRRIATAGGLPEEVHRCDDSEDEPEIEAVAVTKDRVVVACGGTLTGLDAKTGDVAWTWRHVDVDRSAAMFHALVASADGSLIAAGGTDRTVAIWDAASGRQLARLPGQPHWIQGCRFSADGSRLVTACRDGVIRVFDVSKATEITAYVGHVGRVWDLEVEPDGGILSAGADGTVRRWAGPDTRADRFGREIPVIGPAIRNVRDATLSSPDALLRIVAGRLLDSPLLVTPDDDQARVFLTPDHPLGESIAVDAPRDRIAFGFTHATGSRVPLLASLTSGSVLPAPALPPKESTVTGPFICWTPAGELVSTSLDGHVVWWTPALDRLVDEGAVDAGTSRVAAAPVGPSRVAVAAKPGVIVHLGGGSRTDSGMLRLEPLGDHLSAVAWSPDGLHLSGGYRDGTIHVFDAASGRRVGSLAPHGRQVVDIAYSADGRIVVTADADGVRISDAATLTMFDEFRPGWQIDTMCLAGSVRSIVIAGHDPAANADSSGRLAVIGLDRP